MLPGQMYRTFFTVMGIMVACYLLRAYLNYIVSYYGHTFGIRVEADIRKDLFRHMQDMSFDFYDKNRTGQLMSRLTADLNDITELAHHGPEDLLTSALTMIGAVAVMATIQWQLALIVGLMVPLFAVLVMTMRRRMRNASRKVKEKTAHINAEIETSAYSVISKRRKASLP